MAAGRLPAPGTELGPCVDDCPHRDCMATRAQAEAECYLCGESIGYETRFYCETVRVIKPGSGGRWIPTLRYAHAACEEADGLDDPEFLGGVAEGFVN